MFYPDSSTYMFRAQLSFIQPADHFDMQKLCCLRRIDFFYGWPLYGLLILLLKLSLHSKFIVAHPLVIWVVPLRPSAVVLLLSISWALKIFTIKNKAHLTKWTCCDYIYEVSWQITCCCFLILFLFLLSDDDCRFLWW